MSAPLNYLAPTPAFPQTLADAALLGDRQLWKDVLAVGAWSLVTAAAAQVVIPMVPVPFTGQTFAVLLGGMVLGWKRGMAAQITYLTAGVCGAPVFTEFGFGAAKFLGPTGGYLLAFPLAAAVTGLLAERGWGKNFFRAVAAMLIGSLVIFALGLAALTRFVPADSLLMTGLLPFLPGELIKASLAALVLPAAWKWFDGERSR